LYLPRARWYDFWNGEEKQGPIDVEAAAPLSRIPLFVKGGSIVPMGPDVQWASGKPASPIELRVYPGADSDFTLYEDQGDGYQYERGVYSTIPMHWSESTRTLTIGQRKGQFPGMLGSRTFEVVFVGNGHGVGIDETAETDKTITYDGSSVDVKQ
jgi:alpha-D-xyloside xylohydrolase